MIKKIKKKRGRPSPYNEKFHPKLVEVYASMGMIDKQIAKELNVSEVTLIAWKKKHPEFLKALKRGKKKPDDLVQAALLKKALGYEESNVKIFQFKGSPVIVPYTRIVDSDVTAQIFWLKNRRPEQWREQQHNIIEGEVVDMIAGILSKSNKNIKVEKE